MSTFNINNESQWNSLSITNGDTINLHADITFTSQPNTLNIGTGTTFNGMGYTLTYGFNGPAGVFELFNGTIENVTIDADGKTMGSQHGIMLTSLANQYGTIRRCTVQNGIPGYNGGGFGGSSFGDNSNPSVIEYCNSNIVYGDRTGGIAGAGCKNLTISFCYCTGTDILNTTGTFIGGMIPYSMGSITIQDSYVDVNVGGGGTNGGFFGSAMNSTINIDRCYMLGNVNTGAGGFFGRTESGSPVSITMNDCYIAGAINGGNAFGASGVIDTIGSGSSLTLNNFYQSGTVSGTWGYGIIDSNNGTITASNVYINTTSIKGAISGVTTNINTIDTSLPSGWSSSIWTITGIEGQYPKLKSFEDTNTWSGYSLFTDAPTLNSEESTSGGDPHIVTIYGESYMLSNELKQVCLFSGITKSGLNCRIIGYCRKLNSNELDKIHYIENDLIKKVDLNKQVWLNDYTFIYRILINIGNEMVFIDTINNEVCIGNINHLINCYFSEPEKGIYSIIHKKNYPLTETTKLLIVKSPFFKLNIKTDLFWDDLNEFGFIVNKNQFVQFDGALIRKN